MGEKFVISLREEHRLDVS